ncbi:hypothetical protein Sru01_21630 [Sphaerisporangium rufum]|uniref:DUF2867 domain-containing protein n=1 Tax=Sphaerisporangium rufum TaxID=1381558 RepID=A0A919QZW4_9ACTN|nr:hypothetical protein [Sphaerisporangium rufum]GII77181.1 hypothetical protein Sru01_21630 [Sphaerisporangium rufum]
MTLDAALPRWDRRERHRVRVSAAPEVVIDAAERLTWHEVPLFRAIMTAMPALGRRSLAPGGRVLDTFTDAGFAILHRDRGEILVGAIEGLSARRPMVTAAGRTVEEFRAFDRPGHIKIGMNFRCVDGELSTETRVQATSAPARRMFAVYWLAIRAGSGLIRHVWLRAIRRRAAATPPARRSAAG